MTIAFLLAAAAAAIGPQARPDVVVADFEGADYGRWTVTGTAFGSGPARGTLPNQMKVSGFRGNGLVNSFNGGDASTGTLTSTPFTISRRYLNFLIGGGMHPGQTCMNLLVDGRAVRTATGPNDRPGGTERLDWRSWDLRDLAGRSAVIEIVDRATGGWGHINVDEITLSDSMMQEPIDTTELYNETYRPQFHFTPRAGWTNDPNGLVFYRGEYHLFFQHNPFGIEWGNMTWGHAVSQDLIHWRQMPNAIEPDSSGTIWSGSAVVDWNNTAGFHSGADAALVAFYTAAGDTSPESKGQPFTQRLAYSNDRGRSWTKYAGNPVVPQLAPQNRDPKVVWYAPSRRWIMALFLQNHDYALLYSPDLKTWKRLQTITMPDCGECPDFFEMPVAGSAGESRWIFMSASGRYYIGSFDGSAFTPEAGPTASDEGANFYATQTYSDIPKSDGRRIQIAWMNGGRYPEMPFNQQMSFPCELTLRRTTKGLRIYRWPVASIAALYSSRRTLRDIRVADGKTKAVAEGSELWDVEAEFEIGAAKELGIRCRGEEVLYTLADGKVRCLGREAALEPTHGRIQLRALVDRTSLEVFGGGGIASLTSCFLPRRDERKIEIFARGGIARLVRCTVHALRSAWPAADPKMPARP